MSETLSKIIAMMIAVLLLFIFPIENMLARQDDIARIFVLNETTKFVDSIRNLGYITPTMYLQFTTTLSATGNIYQVSMEHQRTTIDPIYIDPVDKTSFQHNYGRNRNITYTDEIMETLFPEGPLLPAVKNYSLSKGDIFTVQVTNQNKTASTRIQEMLLMVNLPVKRIVVIYGGMVRDESN